MKPTPRFWADLGTAAIVFATLAGFAVIVAVMR